MPRSSKEQGEAVQKALETLEDSKLDAATTHLREAATHINSRQFADSIADSIHAVESVARTIDPASNTLGPALKTLETRIKLHPALKDAFSKLYGYTSDEQGIRHALIDRRAANVDLDDAVFMYGACASFSAYLASKHKKAGKSSTAARRA